ncbi:MAG TPA: hypothetical protein VNI02_01045 [Blastocatellia bacterium]|jgi:hypothetical protein|nr:hypothetical protein [Blastocatellia bacterium]
MRLFLFLVVAAAGLTGWNLPAKTLPNQKGNLDSPLRLHAGTESGTDYKKRGYISYTWYVKNVGAGNVWLPLPKDRFLPKSTPHSHFLYRARAWAGWTSRRLADHDVNYKADWLLLPPGGEHRLFTTTFYQGDEVFREVEVPLTYRDMRGKIHKGRLSWLASPQHNVRRAPDARSMSLVNSTGAAGRLSGG